MSCGWLGWYHGRYGFCTEHSEGNGCAQHPLWRHRRGPWWHHAIAAVLTLVLLGSAAIVVGAAARVLLGGSR